MRDVLVIGGLLLFSAPGHAVADAPAVNHLFPAGGAIGASVDVTISGKPGDKPLQIVASRPGLSFEIAEKKDKLKVHIADDALPGVYWLRFFNDEGVSELKPFLVGYIVETNETEPNDRTAEAQKPEALPIVVNGILNKGGDVDTYAVPLKAGQTLIAALNANRDLGSPMDGILQVLDPYLTTVAHNDDDHGMDPRLVVEADRDGIWFVRVFGFPATPNSTVAFAGGANFIYRLTLTTGPFVDHAVPVPEPGPDTVATYGWNMDEELNRLAPTKLGDDTLLLHHPRLANCLVLPSDATAATIEQQDGAPKGSAQTIVIPQIVVGHIAADNERDRYRLKATKGRKLSFRVDARSGYSPLDPVLAVQYADRKVVKEMDDTGRNEFDCLLNLSIPADGEFDVEIRDRFGGGGPRFVYRLLIADQTPDFEISTDANQYVIKSDKETEIPVAINRLNGFDQEVRIEIVDPPDGLAYEAVTSAGKGDSAKKVTLKVKSTGDAYQGSLKLVGTTNGDAPVGRTATAPIAGVKHRTSELWFTLVGAEKPKAESKPEAEESGD